MLIKRDDLTGLATGGNKTRKLEFLIADALDKGADTVITAGGPQSNHCRQTAAAARKVGMSCHLVFGSDPVEALSGNLFLDTLLGAELHWTPKGTREKKMESVAEELRSKGATPYIIPVGGSNSVGALGYVTAMHELMEQLRVAEVAIDHIVFATSSGGTQAGIVVGAKMVGYQGKITAISIDQVPDEQDDFKYQQFVLGIANAVVEKLRYNYQFSTKDLPINYDFLGAGYGVVGDSERKAIRALAQSEGILVGPVYTGRALGGLMSLIECGQINKNEKVLFWHTGDESALHAYVHDLV
jgi:D-cysteine desulfhydrase